MIVKFWLTGHDSAGQTIGGAGSFGTSVNSGAGTYELAYESAQFSISRVDMSVDKPMAQTDFDLLIDFQNDGNKEGILEIQIVTWIGGEASSPVTHICPFSVQPGEDTRWRISMDQFPNPATNVSYVILDMNNEEIASIPAFNVAKYAEDEEGGNGQQQPRQDISTQFVQTESGVGPKQQSSNNEQWDAQQQPELTPSGRVCDTLCSMP